MGSTEGTSEVSIVFCLLLVCGSEFRQLGHIGDTEARGNRTEAERADDKNRIDSGQSQNWREIIEGFRSHFSGCFVVVFEGLLV